MKANTTVISREIDTGWCGDGGTGCIEGDNGLGIATEMV